MFLVLHPMESISLNSFVLLEHLAMLLTSTLTINCYLRNFSNKAMGIINFAKTFSKFYRRYYDLISKFQVALKALLHQGFSEPDFYGDLVYKLKKIVGSNNFSAQFIRIIPIIKRLAITLMYCNRLHAWWSTQSQLATLLSSLIARQCFRLYEGSDLKTYLLIRW